MPFRAAMRALLDGAARREELVALRETERAARMAVQEAKARAACRPWPTPISIEPADSPNGKRAA